MGEQSASVPNLSPRKRHFSRKRVLLIVVVALAIAVGIFFAFVYHKAPTTGGQAVTYPQLSGQKLASKVNGYVNQKEYSKAIDLINAQKDSAENRAFLASVYIQSGDFRQALTVLTAATKKYGETEAFSAGMARAEAGLKNYTAAIKDYKQAIKLAQNSPTPNPGVGSDILYYNQQIQELQKL